MDYKKSTIVPLLSFIFLLQAPESFAANDLSDIQLQINSCNNSKINWSKGNVQAQLHDQLSVDEVVQIAFLNNPSVQATFQNLGVAHSELIERSLIKNPTVDVSLREQKYEGGTNREFEFRQDILDLLSLPLRKRVARQQFEQAKSEIAKEIFDFDKDVREAYYTLQAAKQSYDIQKKIVIADEAAAELAERQLKAGNISDIVLTGHQMALAQTQMALSETELEMQTAREELSRLMGLSSDQIWDIPHTLPYVSQEEPALEELMETAMEQNYGLAAARLQVKASERAIVVNRLNMIPDVEAGYNTEKDSDGGKTSGPVFGAEIPIFDRNQSGILRAKSELIQSQNHLKSKEIEIASEIKTKHLKLLTARNRIESYKNSILPLQAQFIESLQKHYNFMLVGVYDLLDAKKEEMESYHQFVETLKEYWIIRSELENVVGERFAIVPYTHKSDALKTKASDAHEMDHHNHGGHK